MLRLNPNDNQCIRYHLITVLLSLRKYKEAEKLLNNYKDDASATWLYSKAFLHFHQKSKKSLATKDLIKAMKFNPYVLLYFFGLREMPDQLS